MQVAFEKKQQTAQGERRYEQILMSRVGLLKGQLKTGECSVPQILGLPSVANRSNTRVGKPERFQAKSFSLFQHYSSYERLLRGAAF